MLILKFYSLSYMFSPTVNGGNESEAFPIYFIKFNLDLISLGRGQWDLQMNFHKNTDI
jgi:hypothetical protein